MPNIQIRINEKDKKEAMKIFEKIGLDMSSAVRLFIRQATIRKDLSFLLMTENNLSLEEEAKIIKASDEAKSGKNVSRKLEEKEAPNYLKSSFLYAT